MSRSLQAQRAAVADTNKTIQSLVASLQTMLQAQSKAMQELFDNATEQLNKLAQQYNTKLSQLQESSEDGEDQINQLNERLNALANKLKQVESQMDEVSKTADLLDEKTEQANEGADSIALQTKKFQTYYAKFIHDMETLVDESKDFVDDDAEAQRLENLQQIYSARQGGNGTNGNPQSPPSSKLKL